MGLISKECLLFRLSFWKAMVKWAMFPKKTYQIVDDPANNDIISWNDDGSSFIVWNPTVFASDLLLKHFRHKNFPSFHRQLNKYGFHMVNDDPLEFSNELFRRGQTRLLRDILPIPSKGARPAVPAVTVAAAPPLPQGTGSLSISCDEQAISLNLWPAATPVFCRQTSSGSTSKLIDDNERQSIDNERLRKENSQLNRELREMRNLCHNIYASTSNYANKPAETGSQAVKLLDLNSGETSVHGSGSQSETEKSQRLFGVEIGVKRTREGK